MAGGNRAVIYCAVPPPLKELVNRYRIARGKQSFADALIELLETHPAIASMVLELYSGQQD
jgi:hypothetical protein